MNSILSEPGRWKTASRVLLFLLGCALVLIVSSPLAPRLGFQWSQAVVGLATSVATLALTLVFVRWDGVRLANVGAAPRRETMGRLLIGCLVGLSLVVAQSGLFTLVAHVRWIRSDISGWTPIVSSLAAYLLLACREEMAFHGYPLRRLERSFGLWAAQLFVALVFALEHLAGGYSWMNALFGAFVGSILFGMAALTTRGLAVPIGVHAAWNFGEWIIGEKEIPGFWKPVIAGGHSATADHITLSAYMLVFGIATLGFWWYRRATLTVKRGCRRR